MKNNIIIYFIQAIFIISLFIPLINAQDADEGDIMLSGFELEKLLALIIGILSTILFIITFLAYKRDGRNRLLYISIAFLLFAIKNLLLSSELFFPDIDWFDPLIVILEFAAILSFFYGTIKK